MTINARYADYHRMRSPVPEHKGPSSPKNKKKEDLTVRIAHGSFSTPTYARDSKFSVFDRDCTLERLGSVSKGIDNLSKKLLAGEKSKHPFDRLKARTAINGISGKLETIVADLRLKEAPKALINETSSIQSHWSELVERSPESEAAFKNMLKNQAKLVAKVREKFVNLSRQA